MKDNKEKVFKFDLWKIIYIPILLALLGYFVPFLLRQWEESNKENISPRYSIIRGDTLSAETLCLVLRPENEVAKRRGRIDLRIGIGYKRADVSIRDNTSTSLQWFIPIKAGEIAILKKKSDSGDFFIEFGFIDRDSWDKLEVFIADDELEKDKPKEVNNPRQNEGRNDGHMKGSKTIVLVQEKEKVPVFFEAIGKCPIDREKFPNESQAINMAEKGALEIAKTNLLERIKGVFIESTTEIEDYMIQRSEIKSITKGTIKGVYQIGESIITTDQVEVRVKVNKKDALTALEGD